MSKKQKFQVTLNVQFSGVVIVAILLSVATIIGLLTLAEPILTQSVTPWMNRIEQELQDIEKQAKAALANDEGPYIKGEPIPILDEIARQYPQYQFEYEYYDGYTEASFLDNPPELDIQNNNFAVSYLSVDTGIIVVGTTIPEVTRWSLIATLSIIGGTVVLLLLLIGLFVAYKSRYLKHMAKQIEIIGAGDLNTRIKIKGRDEMTQLALHINQMTDTLREQFNKEKTSDIMKKQLIANISHDLRTPLTAVVGYLSLLDQNDRVITRDEQKQYIHRALDKTQNVVHLVNQLFEYVLIANEQSQFLPTWVEPSLVLHQLVMDNESLITESKLELEIDLEPATDTYPIDIRLFQRLMDNLFMNIKKYAIPHTKVHIVGRSNGQTYVCRLTNQSNETYESVQTDFLERYFTTDRVSGESAGLGLAIVHEIIEVHGGELKIECKGNQFQVEMLLKR